MIKTYFKKHPRYSFSALTFMVVGFIGYMVHVVFGNMFVPGEEMNTTGLLYPRESETREVKSLDGVWLFAKSETEKPREGIEEQWFIKGLSESTKAINMPVPSSYNDIVEDETLRDHVGTVWYEKKFYVPKSWKEQRVWIRFGSVHYEAYVWINGGLVVKHAFGHLPFEAEITNFVNYGGENRVTVLCDNVLLQTTIPQGKIIEQDSDKGKDIIQQYSFDFFNYAGIHRSVHLYTTPPAYIKEVIIKTEVDEQENGIVKLKVIASDNANVHHAKILIRNKEREVVASQVVNETLQGDIVIKNVKRWWPFLMHPEPAYLYELEVRLSVDSSEDIDVYRTKFGVRTLKWTDKTFTINDKPIYFRGFGRHEDSDVS
jgi:beta-glucuronidase